MKKTFLFIIILIFLPYLFLGNNFAFADDLDNNIDSQLEEINFEHIEDSADDQLNLFDGDDFKNIVGKIIDGDYSINATTILGKIFNKLFDQIISILPMILTILCVAILSNIVSSFKPTKNGEDVSNIVHFICVAVVIILIIGVVKNVYDVGSKCIASLSKQMEILFPIMLTLLASMGGSISASIYQPVVALLTTGVSAIFSKIIYPIFIISFILTILNSLTEQVKLNKFISFLNSLFKWSCGLIFTLFSGVMVIQGISAGKYDTITLKATRYAMKSSIPIVGGFLSDGLDYVLLSGILVKNGVGFVGILYMISTILVPLLSIIVLKLGLQAVAGVIDITGDSKVSVLCEGISKILIYPIVIILCTAFMYFLSLGLIMCTCVGV